MNNYKLYIHTTPENKVYVGITCNDVEKRWKNGHGYKNQTIFFNAIIKHGWNNISHTILFENLNKKDAEKLEKEMIKKYKSDNPKYGYNYYRQHISKENKENILTIKNSEEKRELWKKKVSDSLKKYYKNNAKPVKEGKKVICIETSKVYVSISEAGRQNNIAQTHINACCTGRLKKAGGYHWQYYKE